MSLPITLHILACVIWVGGMFFAHFMLRPAAAELLPPEQRLPLWAAVFKRFFFWVWISSLTMPITGYWIIFGIFGGMVNTGVYIHIMSLTGWLMLAIYSFIYFKPYQQLQHAVSEQNWSEAAGHLNTMRVLVTTNLHLGLLTIVIASGGKYLAI